MVSPQNHLSFRNHFNPSKITTHVVLLQYKINYNYSQLALHGIMLNKNTYSAKRHGKSEAAVIWL